MIILEITFLWLYVEIKIKSECLFPFYFHSVGNFITKGMKNFNSVNSIGDVSNGIGSILVYPAKIRRIKGKYSGVHMGMNITEQVYDPDFVDGYTIRNSRSSSANTEP